MARRTVTFAILVALTLAGCSRETNANIQSIKIVGMACRNCLPDVVISANGTNDQMATGAFANFPLDEFRALQGHAAYASGGPTIEVRYKNGTQELGIGPNWDDGTSQHVADGVRHLTKWMKMFPFVFMERATEKRTQALSRAFRTGAVRSISLRVGACGLTCEAYSVTFRMDGHATIWPTFPNCARAGQATIDFARVQDIVAPRAPYLLASYPVHWEDTATATIAIVTSAQTFVSYGPDSASWNRSFSDTEARLDQLVRDTIWTPKLDMTCRGSRTR